ncbi:MAG: hypothetical protein H6821_10670 [Planctomycetaceae bacterium]|nr:hypothetical protein [Planctomycetales bacterium]MCB9874629.1 hypothetical protein [Planctomycetaceae bacterium]MCB9936947.1 hypothetical protein [Planctomycetaceae bacterium]
MAKTTLIEKVSIITSAIRTLLTTVIVGGLGIGGWYGYNTYNATEREAQRSAQALTQARADLEAKEAVIRVKEQEIGALNTEVAKQQEEIERLDTAMRLLKVDHRMAMITVLDQTKDEATETTLTQIDFQEINDNGDPIGMPKRFEIKGDVLYIDSWVVKFDDKYVEQADIDRSTSLVLFRRVFGEMQEPREGFALDEDGARPAVYGRGGEMSEFEKKIWSDFWEVANSEAKQDELGIRAVHGEAPSIKMKKGKAYRVDLRSSGGLSITTAGDIATPTPPPV